MASVEQVNMQGVWVNEVPLKQSPRKSKAGQPGQQKKDNEWWTPEVYVNAAREVMGGAIDLDPASCEQANTALVKASRYFTKEDDGLSQRWTTNGKPSRIWLNPPYGKIGNTSLIRLFTNKLVNEYDDGNVEEAVLLTTSDTDASWFKQLWQFPICFADHNVYFYRPDKHGNIERNTRHGHWFGTIFVYVGPNRQRFTEVFSRFGAVR